jgi:hypothetical protein
MNHKLFFFGLGLLALALSAQSQTPNLQTVTGQGNTTTNSISILSKDGLGIGVDPVNAGLITHYIKASSADRATLRFDCPSNAVISGWEFYNSNENKSLMYIRQNTGLVGIGTADPTAKLAVNGELLAKKVKITLNIWPDYVFEPSYSLRSLDELERFISIHKHLPDIPSANEISRHDLDLGENQAKLLQKIEEMTLYLIAQDKELMSQEQLLNERKRLLLEQERRLFTLEEKAGNKIFEKK